MYCRPKNKTRSHCKATHKHQWQSRPAPLLRDTTVTSPATNIAGCFLAAPALEVGEDGCGGWRVLEVVGDLVGVGQQQRVHPARPRHHLQYRQVVEYWREWEGCCESRVSHCTDCAKPAPKIVLQIQVVININLIQRRFVTSLIFLSLICQLSPPLLLFVLIEAPGPVRPGPPLPRPGADVPLVPSRCPGQLVGRPPAGLLPRLAELLEL